MELHVIRISKMGFEKLFCIVWIFTATLTIGYSQQFLPEHLSSDSACYASGKTKYSTINSQCRDPDSVIAVLAVQAATKPASRNCSQVLSAPDSSFFSRCCTVNSSNDCIVPYNNTANESYTYEIQNVCTGYNKCTSPVRVMWMEVLEVCNKTVFPSHNNFMVVDYFCIKKSKIMNMGSTSARKEGNDSVYLQSNGYPGVYRHFDFDEWCEIDGINATDRVQVVLIDVQLAGSTMIVFKDAESCRDVKNITNLDNNKYQIRNIFNLKNRFFVSYKANTTGRFWIGFVSPQKLTITCGLTIDENCTVRHLPDDSSMSATSSALSSNISGSNSPSSPPWWIAIIVALLAGVVIAIVLYKRHKRKQKVSDEMGDTDPGDVDILVVTPSERNLIAPAKTNIDIFIPEKPNNALPKLDDLTRNENTSTERKKKKKKRKKRAKNKNVDAKQDDS